MWLPLRLRSPRDTYSGSHEQMLGANEQVPHSAGATKTRILAITVACCAAACTLTLTGTARITDAGTIVMPEGTDSAA